MKMFPFLSAYFCLAAALAVACSSGAGIPQYSTADGANQLPGVPDARASGNGGTMASPTDAPPGAGGGAAGQAGSGGAAANGDMDAPPGGTIAGSGTVTSTTTSTTTASNAPDTSTASPTDAPPPVEAGSVAPDSSSETSPEAGTIMDGSVDTADARETVDRSVGARLTLSTPLLNFGAVDVGRGSAPALITVTNTGTPVEISPIVTGAGFSIDSTTCGMVTASCAISLTFFPTAIGPASGVLTVAPGLTVSLSGIGSPAGTLSVTVSEIPPTRLVNQSAEIFVTVTATAALTDLVCVPSGADLIADAASTTCAVTLPTPCVYAFTFKAATPGSKSDTVVCSAGGSVKTVPVFTPASLAVAPNPASFSAMVGSTSAAITFNVANTGGLVSGSLTTALAGASASEFAVTDNKCVLPLAPLSTCAIQVVFKPVSAGNKGASLTVTDATSGSTPATASLIGTAVGPPALAITGPADMGSVVVGQSGISATFTVTNSGGTASGALTLTASDAQFAIGSDLCSGLALGVSKTCTLTVSFNPTSVGAKSAILGVFSGGLVWATRQIQGTGLPAKADAGP